MQVETFETRREFKKRFPSKLYICSNCGGMTASPDECFNCNWSANCLLKTMEKGYRYIIKEESENINEIFTPIELLRQEGEKQWLRID